jgi:hypothetical protein
LEERAEEGETIVLSRFRLPSPALVIASIALILAVGGGSFALAISDHKQDKRIAKRIANRQIRRKAHTLQVKHARVARRAKFAGEATNAGSVNGVVVKQFSVKVQPNQPGVVLADTGIAQLRGTCDGGQHGVLLTKDVGSPPLVFGSTAAAGNSNTVHNHGAADFSGTQTIDAGNGAGASIGHAEVTSTDGHVNTFEFLGRDASNFSPGENVCVFSGTVSYH